MTVKEFYDYAVKYGLKNAKIILNYEADDGWYSINKEIKKEYLKRGDKALIIDI